ncbi:DUF4157 domain-containing protein [Mucilaginibacter sp. McL0603]|uniref:eCIS core domain-containing protein n=1 Tax=Mucilaginibacter sp. McL0603 TaxID=3415670 RepID=UPI003CF26032
MRNVHQRAIANPQQIKANQALKQSPENNSETTSYDSRNVLPETHSYDFGQMPLFAPLFIQRKSDGRNDVYEQEADQQKVFSSVQHALSSPAIMLVAPVKEHMGNMLQFNFESVKVHNNPVAASSAQQLNARAYTTNGHVVFGADEYQPQHKEGRKLIAHELTHVVQQVQHPTLSGNFISQPSDSAEIEAGKIADAAVSTGPINVPKRLTASPVQLMRAPTQLGTSKTTSPVANLDPRKEMINQVSNELTLMDNAQVIITWVQFKVPPTGASVDPAERIPGIFSFGADELFNDKKVIKKLKPIPKTVEDLRATLDLMIYYNVLTRPIFVSTLASEPEYLLRKNMQTKKPDLDKFNESHKGVGDLKKSLDKKEERPNPLDPMVETTILQKDMAAGAKEEIDAEKNAEKELAKLIQELDTLNSTGTDDEAT